MNGSAADFPGLGFDPAPGRPTELESAAVDLDGAARTLGATAAALTDLASIGWTGPAADAYRDRLGGLPSDLDDAHAAHVDAATALRDFAGRLAGLQREGRTLDARAVEVRTRRSAALDEVNRIAADSAPVGSAELAMLRTSYRSARARVDELDDELTRLVRRARELGDAHRTAADRAMALLRTAAGAAPFDEPPWWRRAWDATKRWVADNSEGLRTLSTVLGATAGVLGLLAAIPVIGAGFGTAALVLGGAAVLIDLGVTAAGKGSWSELGLTAAMSFVPGGRLVGALGRLARAAVPGARSLRSARAVATAEIGPDPFLDLPRRLPVDAAGNEKKYFHTVAELEHYWGGMIRTDGSAFARSQIEELRRVPTKVHLTVRDNMLMSGDPRAGIYVADDAISGVGYPRVHDLYRMSSKYDPNGSVDEVWAGVYDRTTTAVVASNRPGNSGSVLLHEFGHAADHAYGDLSQTLEFHRFHQEIFALADPRKSPWMAHYRRTAREGFAAMFDRNYRGDLYFNGSLEAMARIGRHLKALLE